jgi:opine dehydrogenase
VSSSTTVAVLGAGNVGISLAADLALRGHQVRLCTRSQARLDPLAGGLEVTGAVEGTAPVAMLTTSVADAVRGAEVVAVTVPTPALPYYSPALADALTPEQLLWFDPGHCGGALFLAAEIARRTGRAPGLLCQLSTASHISRLTGPATSRVFMLAGAALAGLPGSRTAECLERVDALLPGQFTAAETVLEVDLMNINALMHPVQMVTNASWIEATGGDFAVYAEGSGPGTCRVIEAVDAERLALAARLGVRALPFAELMLDGGFTSAEAAARGRAREVFAAAELMRAIKAPPALDHRYLHEDVGWGLVPWAELADAAGVDVPAISALVTLGGILGGADYRRDGLTLGRMGLAGLTADQIVARVRDGGLSAR